MENTEIQDKIRGSLIGGAAGDALGYAIEFDNEKTIWHRFGSEGIQAYALHKADGKARISDDTQMTLFTADGILVNRTNRAVFGMDNLPRKEVAGAYIDWLQTQSGNYEAARRCGRKKHGSGVSWLLDVPELHKAQAPGLTCMRALNDLSNYRDFKEDYIRVKVNDSKGCGGVMRVAPAAFVPDADSLAALDWEAAQMAAITHGHPLGYMPAAVLCHVLNRLVYSGFTMQEAVLDARAAAEALFPEEETLPALLQIMDLALELARNEESDLENIHKLGKGWVAEEALAIALYCALKYEHDFSAGLIASVNHGGDSDSTGAIAGNLLGAVCGYAQMDGKWKENLELHDVILEISDDLASLSWREDYRTPAWGRKYIDMHRWTEE